MKSIEGNEIEMYAVEYFDLDTQEIFERKIFKSMKNLSIECPWINNPKERLKALKIREKYKKDGYNVSTKVLIADISNNKIIWRKLTELP